MGTCFCLNYQPPVKSSVWFFSWKISFSPKSWMFMESDHGGKTSLTNSSSFAPRTLSSLLWTLINKTKTSTLSQSSWSLFDPIYYSDNNHPIQSPKYFICLQYKDFLYKLSLLTKQVVVRAQHPWVSGCQKLSTNSLYHLLHIKTSLCLFFVLFWYNFFAIDSAWIQKKLCL